MKFRFCGELDCPDWILAEIATLSRITSIRMRVLCNEVVSGLLGAPYNMGEVLNITSDAKYNTGDAQACIAALGFIFMSSAKNEVNEETLSSELQQLGLPKESTSALCKVFSKNYKVLQAKCNSNSLKLTEIRNLNWRIDHIITSNSIETINEPSILLSLEVKEHQADDFEDDDSRYFPYYFSMSPKKFIVLLHDLKQAYSYMEEISTTSED